MEGFERGRNLEKVGRHSQDTAELFFTDVRVPSENLLGEENQGFYYMMFNLPQERLNIAVSAVAGTQYAFNITRLHKREACFWTTSWFVPEFTLQDGGNRNGVRVCLGLHR